MNAVLSGNTDLAVGNIVGSNIFNVLFILGVSALIIPLVVNAQIIRQEIPVLILTGLLLLGLSANGRIGFLESGILLAALAGYTAFLIFQSRKETQATRDEYAAKNQRQSDWDRPIYVQVLLILAGLALLVS